MYGRVLLVLFIQNLFYVSVFVDELCNFVIKMFLRSLMSKITFNF